MIAMATAQMVKELREKTGAGMMDCKAALTETDGDIEAAVDWLRTKGLAKAAKKAGRVAAEGLIGVAADADARRVMVEVNSETDFVARNAEFQALVAGVAKAALGTDGDVDGDPRGQDPGRPDRRGGDQGGDRHDRREHVAPPLGELIAVENGAVATYVHSAGRARPRQDRRHRRPRSRPATRQARCRSAGRWRCTSPPPNPLAVRADELDPDVVARERAIFAEQARESGKPEAIIEKMVEGRMRKFYEEVVLLSQAFVVDPDEDRRAGAEGGRGGRRRADHGDELRRLPRSARASRRPRATSPPKSPRPPASRTSRHRRSRRSWRRSRMTIAASVVYRQHAPAIAGSATHGRRGLAYKRVLLKVSGEALLGDQPFGIDDAVVDRIAGEIGEAVELGVKVAVVIGGGNIFRGMTIAKAAATASPATRWACSRP